MWEKVKNSNSDLVAKENQKNNTARTTRSTRSTRSISNNSQFSVR
ncbi:hypothetical protein [Okeania sp. SIO3I5]|nr:hypothetical protein [Okeania sp. SIO3I5]